MALPRFHFTNVVVLLAWFSAWIGIMGVQLLHSRTDALFAVAVIVFVGSVFALLLFWDVRCSAGEDPQITLSFFRFLIAQWALNGFADARMLTIPQMWGRSVRETMNSINLVGLQMLFRNRVILLRAKRGMNLLVSPSDPDAFRRALSNAGIAVA